MVKEDGYAIGLLTIRGVISALTNSCKREDSSRLSRSLNLLLYLVS